MLEKICIFAVAFESGKCKQEKHCNTVLLLKYAKFPKEDGAKVLSLVCVCYYVSAYRQA